MLLSALDEAQPCLFAMGGFPVHPHPLKHPAREAEAELQQVTDTAAEPQVDNPLCRHGRKGS